MNIEALTPEDREQLFIALYEEYEWLPERFEILRDMIPIPYNPGVRAPEVDILQDGK